MTDIDTAGTFTARRPHREAHGLRRHAARRARACSGRPRTATPRSPCCARRWRAASTTSTPATTTARTSPTSSSARRCIPIPTISSSSPRSAPGAATTRRGSRRFAPTELTQAVHDNLRNLGARRARRRQPAHHGRRRTARPRARSRRRSPRWPSCSAQGLVRHIGLSNVTADAGRRRRGASPTIVCVQNHYNLAHRDDDALIDELAARRHRLRAVLPARRLHAAAVVDAVRRRGASSARRRCRSRWPGCCSARPTSC